MVLTAVALPPEVRGLGSAHLTPWADDFLTALDLSAQDHLEMLGLAKDLAANGNCNQYREGCVVVDARGFHQGSGFREHRWTSGCGHGCRGCRGMHAALMAGAQVTRRRQCLVDGLAYFVRLAPDGREVAPCLSCLQLLADLGVTWVGLYDDLAEHGYRVVPLSLALEVAL